MGNAGVVCSEGTVEDGTDVVYMGKVREEGAEIRKLRVVRVVEPAADGDRVVGMEDVAGGRVVNDDGVGNLAS